MTALEEIANERRRQIGKGYDAAHDNQHDDGSIAQAAAAYALVGCGGTSVSTGRRHVRRRYPSGSGHEFVDERAEVLPRALYPWGNAFTPGAKREALIVAAALCIAEIERLDRATLPNGERRAD